MSYLVEEHDAAGFLARVDGFLRRDEARHNLMLGLAAAVAEGRSVWTDVFFASVTDASGGVCGCVVRTPPHKALVTDLPAAAAEAIAERLAARYDAIPAVLGPAGAAEAVARAWVALRGGTTRAGMRQGLYRLDEVVPPPPTEGGMRVAGGDDVELAQAWGEAFGRDTGVPFPSGRDPILHWVDRRALHLWEVGGERVSIAVVQGRTGRGVRVGYVYTPPERRGRGYASALVAELSQKMLDSGCAFCVLYTDLSNPTSNAVYRRIGYRLIEELCDIDVVADG